ncbi:SCO6880 family protein [Kocuria sp. HSID16901]|uniref:SCO6880 family protein n=1 Tax=Kocuria sp. HSID16901 TaxID=2419505 RepID=UPI000F85F1BC|nr:SCO6880 family protein [Kocuria sp. HSID16901]RUQ19817.1 hypothetical protein D8M21_10870 [Kocuria sp. HSID16901]
MAAADTEYTEPTYGNWRVPARAGLGPLSVAATLLFFAVILTTIFLLLAHVYLLAVLTFVVGMLFVVLMSITDKYGVSISTRFIERRVFMFNKRLKRNRYRSGPLSATGKPNYSIPGVAATSEIHASDALDRPFGIVHIKSTSTYSIAIAVEPDGAALVDQESVDQWVANWGGFLSSLGRETGLIGCSATVETSPGSGHQLRQEIEHSVSDTASPMARMMLEQASVSYPSGMADIRCWVTLTFAAAPRPGMRKRKTEEVVRDISSKVPAYCARLESTGAGVATPMTPEEIAETVRIAYDPKSARLFENAMYAEEPVELNWEDVGPSMQESEWETLRHDSGISRCWSMVEAPRGQATSNVLSALVAPHPGIDRKRVTMLYRPIDAGQTAAVVERDKNQAQVRASSGKARAADDLRAAQATANEESKGAGLLYFGLISSITVSEKEDLEDAVAAMEHDMGPSARLLLRPCYGWHDAAFAATLPLGVMLPRHTLFPQTTRVAV